MFIKVTMHEVVVSYQSVCNHEEELEEAESPKKKNIMKLQYKVNMDMCLAELMSVYL